MLVNHIQKEYTFISGAYPETTFTVARFTGAEGISRLYEFDITLIAEDSEIDSGQVLRHPARFTIWTQSAEIPFHGILSQFEQLQAYNDTVFYRAVLVPRLWQASLYPENQLFLDKRVPEVIEKTLNQAGLFRPDDFQLPGSDAFKHWEYICQFRETGLDFISRWMEREGLYYYFEQADDSEKVIITNNAISHKDVSGQTAIPYHPPSGLKPIMKDCVHTFTCRHQAPPARVVLKDYNYRRPALEMKGEADVDPQGGRGTVYLYGEHFQLPEEGNALARIRAEEYLCRERVFYGESMAANLRPGFVFELTGHYRDSYNQHYLVTEVIHEGRAARFLPGEKEPAANANLQMGYANQFVAIPADIQFRPERKTPRPRFYGSMNATIDAAGDNQYAEIDDQGRYKVILPFDLSGNRDGKASRWVRMAQPYAGPDYGMHFPLHKGTEVLLSFVDGDPDRPIIAGAVPNPDTMTPVTGSNQTQSMIRTGGGNQIKIEDSDGSQQIQLFSPTHDTRISIGDTEGGGGIQEYTEGNRVITVKGTDETTFEKSQTYKVQDDRNLYIDGKQSHTIKKGVTHTVESGGEKKDITGNRTITIKGGSDTYRVTGNRTVHVTGKEKRKIDGNVECYELGKISEKFVFGLSNEQYVGAKTSIMLGSNLNISKTWDIKKTDEMNAITADSIKNKAKSEIKLNCKESVISIYESLISIEGETLLELMVGKTKIIIGKDGILFKGNVVFDKDVRIKGKLTTDKKNELG